MSAIPNLFHGAKRRHRARRARLPWRQLEAEAARQGVSAADIFFDRAGHGSRPGSGLIELERQAGSNEPPA
jgi:hypothetical protein